MARGWESKSVESQIESYEADRRSAGKKPPAPAQIERDRRKAELTLTRKRVLRDIEQCGNLKYKKILEDSLAYLDARLAELE